MNSLGQIIGKSPKAATAADGSAPNALTGAVSQDAEFLNLLQALQTNPETATEANQLVQEEVKNNPELLKLLQSQAEVSADNINPQTLQAQAELKSEALVPTENADAKSKAELQELLAKSETPEKIEQAPTELMNLENELTQTDAAQAQVDQSTTTDVTNPSANQNDTSTGIQELLKETPQKDIAVPKNEMGLNQAPTKPIDQILNKQQIDLVNNANGSQALEATQTNPLLEDQLMVKNSVASRSPAIDLSPNEVDQQLLNFDDFVAHKNAVTKKIFQPNGYGMPQTKIPAQGASEINAKSSLDSVSTAMAKNQATPLEVGATALPLAAAFATAKTEVAQQTEQTSAPKVLHLNKNQSADEMISDISNYIAQVKTSKEPTVQMRVQHDDLGMLDIVVNKSNQNMINVSINTQTIEARSFFTTHQKDLLSSLTQSGLQVNEFKLENSSSTFNKNDSGSSQSFSQSSFSQKNFGSEQNEKRQDSLRREELWNILREQEVA